MRRSTLIFGLVGFALGMLVFTLVPRHWIFVTVEGQHGGRSASGDTREVWACPMLCVKLDGPGTCPVCGMTLEKIEQTGDVLELNERERRLINLMTAPVEHRVLTKKLRTFGKLTLNQQRVERITAWIPGRITRLFADTVFTDVRKGDHLFEIYSPELFAAQSEYVSALRGDRGLGLDLVIAAEEKLRLYGMTEAQIAALKVSKKASYTTIIHAPATGTIYELHAKEGDYVREGSPLYSIADYGKLWLYFDAYESELPWIAVGQSVEIMLQARPGKTFTGRVEFLDRAVDPTSRTVKVRVVLNNPKGELQPGMFATVEVAATMGQQGEAMAPEPAGRYGCYMHPEVQRDEPGTCPECGMALERQMVPEVSAEAPLLMAIPYTAVLDTGLRQLVYIMSRPPQWTQRGDRWVEEHPAEFEPVEVVLGPRAGDFVQVISGLKGHERVVTQGQFLIDSQMELTGRPSLLHAEGAVGAGSDPHAHH